MPIYKGNTEVASGNLYKGTTEIQDGYKGTNSFYVNEVSISWLNFPGVTDYVITGAPGDTIGVSKSVSWTATAPGGSAYNGTQTATGVPTGFSFTGGQQGDISYTTTSPSVSFDAAVFPNTSTSVDYNNLTVTLPTSTVVTNSYVFTGTLFGGASYNTSCQAFSGSSCTVSTVGTGSSWNRGYAGDFSYWNGSASGTGGYGAGRCYQGCSVSISSSGGTSVCDTNSGQTNQPLTGNLATVCNVGYSNPPASGSVWSNFYCVTPPDPNGQIDNDICGSYQIQKKAPGGTWGGGLQTSSSCAGTPTQLNPLGWRLMAYGGQSVVWDGNRGTWEVKMTSYQGTIMTSASCVVN